jgi:hypothetical protein
LLLEAATTNYLLHSTDVSHAVWLKQNNGGASVPVVTPNYGLAPDGTLAAARVQMKLNGGSTTNDYCRIYQPASVAVGTMYSNSVYVKTIDGSTRTVLLMDDTGGVTSSSPLVNIDGNWKRLSASAVATTTQCNAASIWLFGSQGTSDSVDILVWGGQLEPSMMPTSLLPTDNSSISRSIENASVSLSSGNVFTNLNGSVYVEAYSGSGSGSRVLLQMTSAPALGENVSLTYNPDTELCVMSYQVGVTETIYYSQATHVSKNDTVKCVVSIEKGNVHMAINGAIVPVDNAGGFPSNLDTLTLMPSTVSGGHVKRLSVYPRKLTDDELLALTLL